MNKSYYIGSYRKDALEGPNNGWIVGKFIADEPRKNDDVEIKYWEYKKDEFVKDYLKVSSIIECTLVLKGSTECLINDQRIVLKTGEYIVIKPGTPNNTVAKILDDVVGITIKSPSDPNAKKIV